MARNSNRLTALKVKQLTAPGRYADGDGLYLFVQGNGSRSWVYRWRDRITGKLRDRGLGPERLVSLAKARERAAQCRDEVWNGGDPIAAERERKRAAQLEHAKRTTFAECCDRYIAAHRASWRNEKHAAQWESTLSTYAAPLMPLNVADIDTGLVVKCLEPIWQIKTETASRVRQRIEAVLGWATVRGHREGDNPARWRGHLDTLLPKPNAIRKVEHMAALPHAQINGFITELRKSQGLGARALELQILTAMRPGAVAGARWEEFDLDGALWTIPGDRMKSRKGKENAREHTVPLSEPALRLLRALPRVNEFVFPSGKSHITTAAMLKATRAVREDMDSHGFRSTFRDWGAECTNYPRDLLEAALAHTLKDKTEAAYLRTKLVAKRAPLMADWAKRCEQPDPTGANVVPIRKKSA